MTYARARLWLGITGVGSLVTLSTLALCFGIPEILFDSQQSFGTGQLLQLSAVALGFILWLLPLDFLGGFWLPKAFNKTEQSVGNWLRQYSVAAVSQGLLFVAFGLWIIFSSQQFGWIGGMAAVSIGMAACFFVRNQLLLRRKARSKLNDAKLLDAIGIIQSWQIFVPRTAVVKHTDIGFTGGIVGLGRRAQIIIPESWLKFSPEQLAAAIARRAIAIDSGSYTRGLLVAFAWNVVGFMLCSLLPNAGFDSSAGLVTTVFGFTLWSFLGLLTLPTVSRNASLNIDQTLAQQGMSFELIHTTAFAMDQMQDGEPERAAWIETIFHPVPNVTSRNRKLTPSGFAAWNAARTTLFFSWACLGFLSRSVHCNVGRPELWTMLPTD